MRIHAIHTLYEERLARSTRPFLLVAVKSNAAVSVCYVRICVSVNIAH